MRCPVARDFACFDGWNRDQLALDLHRLPLSAHQLRRRPKEDTRFICGLEPNHRMGCVRQECSVPP